ncbi:unnamed protein product [Paramecium sonneborni]|uniref:Uncharacterized protein n=1 Tax=Paramecium sonneborni TaxID=65129 RepID=A0A8S1LQJ9_9CILI|nr:unnamed protein product [Paramecium sonneborni]
MNIQNNQQHQLQKRIKERFVYEAKFLVDQWRQIFDQRQFQDGKMIKFTLDQAAEIVGVSRKTLEDYYYCLKKAEKIIDINQFMNCKMGVIRRIIKEHKKQTDEQNIFDTNQFFALENINNEPRKNSFEYDD